LSCVVLFFKRIRTGRLSELPLLQKERRKKHRGKEASYSVGSRIPFSFI
jgi:hypothetical protein